MKYIYTLFILLFFLSCALPETMIYGTWKMHQVIQDGEDVSKEHNPFNERTFIMNKDGSFKSMGRPYGENTGKFTFDSSDSSLFLDSDAGPEDDSYWKVEFSGDTMIWQGTQTEWAKRFRIINIREK